MFPTTIGTTTSKITIVQYDRGNSLDGSYQFVIVERIVRAARNPQRLKLVFKVPPNLKDSYGSIILSL